MKSPSRPIAAEPRIPDHRHSFLDPFRHRDFALLWTGLTVGNIGTWMQFTALGYYVAKLAPNAGLGSLYIGLLGASRMIPVLIASPFAGVVADRYPRRQILLSTNALTALLAVLLSVALATNHATLAVVLILSALQGATQSFDAPARQSWVPLLVPRENIANAIGLNAIGLNAPSVFGPPLAGIVIAAFGVSPCMAINAIVKIFVFGMVALMKPAPPGTARRTSFSDAIGESVRFLYRHDVLRWVFALLIVTALSVRSYNFLLPAYAVHVVHTDARGLGWLMAAAGIGALFGALAVAAMETKRRSRLWFASGLMCSAGVAVLGWTNELWVAAVTLVFIGLGTQSFIGSSNVMIQTLAPDEMRGRAISIYSMVLMGLVPGGALLIGSLATVFGLRPVFLAAGLLATVLTLWTYLAQPKLRAS